jgi:ribosome-binding protein aMBF1 (putative translation factor)
MDCEKCGKATKHPARHIYEAHLFNFCPDCSKNVEELEQTDRDKFDCFYRPIIVKRTHHNWVDINIKEAKERRKKGISLWE